MKLWLRILIHFLVFLGVVLVWTLSVELPDYIEITGGWKAWITIASLITLMNMVVTPALNMITLPLKLFATLLAIILVNGVFLWLTVQIVRAMDPDIVTLGIKGGIVGWFVIALSLGLAKWLMKVFLK